MIYFDNAATTIPDERVVKAMIPYLTESFGNPGSVHKPGRMAKKAVDVARNQVAGFLDCEPNHVFFTSGGSEANTMVFRGMEKWLVDNGKTHIITTKGEHESVRNAVDWMESRGFSVTRLDIAPDGTVTAKQVEDAIRPDTGLVSVMYCPNELEGVNPICDIGGICSDRDILFHTDAVQAAGMYLLWQDMLECDFLSFSSHKIHGPKGCGALYVRYPELMEPQVFGGSAQEGGLRSGTENVPAIVGFGAACGIVNHDCILGCLQDYYRCLRDYTYMAVRKHLSNSGYGGVCHRTYDGMVGNKLLSLRFDGVDAETLVLALDAAGVCVSSGSACNSHSSEPSEVLLAAGLTPAQARNTIRISFSRNNTVLEVEQAAEIIANCVVTILEG